MEGVGASPRRPAPVVARWIRIRGGALPVLPPPSGATASTAAAAAAAAAAPGMAAAAAVAAGCGGVPVMAPGGALPGGGWGCAAVARRGGDGCAAGLVTIDTMPSPAAACTTLVPMGDAAATTVAVASVPGLPPAVASRPHALLVHTVVEAGCGSGTTPLLVAVGNGCIRAAPPAAAGAPLPTESAPWGLIPAPDDARLRVWVCTSSAGGWEDAAPYVTTTTVPSSARAATPSLPLPVARTGAASAGAKSRIFFFGGRTTRAHMGDAAGAATSGGDNDVYLNDVFYMSFATNSCSNPTAPLVRLCNATTGSPPTGRCGAALALAGTHTLVVVGGEAAGGCTLSDLAVLHLTQQRWSVPAVSGDVPLPRRAWGAAVVHGTSNIFVFGGRSEPLVATTHPSPHASGGAVTRRGTRTSAAAPTPPDAAPSPPLPACVLTVAADGGSVAVRLADGGEAQTTWGAAVRSRTAIAFTLPCLGPATPCAALPPAALARSALEGMVHSYCLAQVMAAAAAAAAPPAAAAEPLSLAPTTPQAGAKRGVPAWRAPLPLRRGSTPPWEDSEAGSSSAAARTTCTRPPPRPPP